jgi:uncharacterized protein YutE (UPF0331/DUF86 family)
MVKPEVVRRRFEKLDEYLTILNRLKKYSYEDLISDPEHYGSAERFLHLAIEAITDVCNHIIAEEQLGVINWYGDIPSILATEKVISAEQRDIWIRMIGFRNTLVHEYIDVDLEIVYRVLQEGLPDLKAIRRSLAAYL